jgi:hypothetical protein
VQFEEILINDNVITTTSSNTDLELRASGTGNIKINNLVEINNNLSANIVNANSNFVVSTDTTFNTANVSSIRIENNFITTTVSNANLELRAVAAPIVEIGGSDPVINFQSNVVLEQALTVNGTTYLKDTTILGNISHLGNRSLNGNYDLNGELTVDNLYFEDNFISTVDLNSNLELRAAGTGNILINNNVLITNNLDIDSGTTLLQSTSILGTLTQTGQKTQFGNYSQLGNLLLNGNLLVDSKVQFENISIDDNVLETTLSNANLELRAAGTGSVIIPENNVTINNNLFAASIIAGNINIDADLVLNEIIIPPSIMEIDDNFISTKISNADLDLRANGDGVVLISSNDVVIEQTLTVNAAANFKDVSIAGTLTHTGDKNQTGNVSVNGNVTIGTLVTDRTLQFDDIVIAGNVVSTTLSNSNLDLRASGTGNIIFNESVFVEQNLETGTLNVTEIDIADSLSLEELELSTDIQFFDNVITTTNSNSNLELRANGTGSIYLQNLEFNGNSLQTATTNITFSAADNLIIDSTGSLKIPNGTTAQRKNTLGDIRFNTTNSVFEGTGSGVVTFGGVYSSDRRTNVLAHPTNNTIGLTVNTLAVGSVAAAGLTLHGLQVDDVLLNSNTITTTVSNSDLDLQTDGTGELVIDNISFVGNNIKNDGNNLIFYSTGFGRYKIGGTYGTVVPSGTNGERPVADPPIGDTRWNTTAELLETWDGNQYISAAGVSSAISEAEYNDLLLEYTLIFG